MRVVWIVIVAATGAMSFIAASLLAQPMNQNERMFPSRGKSEPTSSCLFCESEQHAIRETNLLARN